MTTSKHAHILITILILVFLNLSVRSQTVYTFSNSTTATINSTATTTRTMSVSGVPTSGMVLRQVNVSFGNGSSSYSGDMAGFTLKLKDPSNNEIVLLSPTSMVGSGSSNSANRSFNIHFRDHAALKTPAAQASASGSTTSKGYPFNFGYYKSEASFSSFNTTSAVNGTWTFSMSGYSTSFGRIFNKVELIFGPPFVVTDIRTSSPLTCATSQCLQTGSIYWAKNNSASTNQASSPPNTVDGCTWNDSKDNMTWYYFVASATTAEVSFSGIGSVQQSIVLKPGASCSSYTLVTGGCYTEMFGSVGQTKYYGGTWASGYAWNHGYKLTGLTIGKRYLFVIDGSSAANTEYYIELVSGASDGCSPLPISLLDFSGEIQDNKIELNWTTLSERENDYYTIYRSQDAVNWEEIAQMDGAGNASDTRYYTSIDQNPLPGVSYYKLKQTDFNGDFEEFDPISIAFEGKTNELYVFPNPSSTGFNLRIELNEIEEGLFNIQDLNGKIILEETHKLSIGDNLISLEGKTLIPGVYILHSKIGTMSLKPVKLIVK